MKIYTQTFDLAKPVSKMFSVAQNSEFGIGIKIVKDGAAVDDAFEVQANGETLTPEADKISGFTIYLLNAGDSDVVYTVSCNGQTFKLTQDTTPSSVFDLKQPEPEPPTKFGATLDTFIGDIADGQLQNPTGASVKVESDEISAIDSPAPYGMFKARVTRVNLPNLTTVGEYGMAQCFSGVSALTSVNLPSLSDVAAGGMTQAFLGCTNLTDAALPGITSLTANMALNNAFKGCTKLESISLPNLLSAGNEQSSSVGNNSIAGLCDGCTSLKYVDFAKLSRFGQGCSTYTFRNCTNLQYVNFSEATAVPYDPLGDAKQTMFKTTNNTFKIIVPDALYEDWTTAGGGWWASLSAQIVKASDYAAVITNYNGADDMDN